jgi:hypothetical protein
MSSPKFKQRVAELDAALREGERKVVSKDNCFPISLAIGAVVPFITSVVLYFLNPRILQKKEGEKGLRDGKKIFWTTIAITLLIWSGMLVYNYYIGYDKMSVLCKV